MVAIVVILAAVIAAFVFGMAGTTSTTKNVAVTVAMGTVNSVSDVGMITIQGGNDLAKVTLLQYSISAIGATAAVPFTNVQDAAGTADATIGAGNYFVGEIVTTGGDPIKGGRLILRADFEDGSQQVIFDKQF